MKVKDLLKELRGFEKDYGRGFLEWDIYTDRLTDKKTWKKLFFISKITKNIIFQITCPKSVYLNIRKTNKRIDKKLGEYYKQCQRSAHTGNVSPARPM